MGYLSIYFPVAPAPRLSIYLFLRTIPPLLESATLGHSAFSARFVRREKSRGVPCVFYWNLRKCTTYIGVKSAREARREKNGVVHESLAKNLLVQYVPC